MYAPNGLLVTRRQSTHLHWFFSGLLVTLRQRVLACVLECVRVYVHVCVTACVLAFLRRACVPGRTGGQTGGGCQTFNQQLFNSANLISSAGRVGELLQGVPRHYDNQRRLVVRLVGGVTPHVLTRHRQHVTRRVVVRGARVRAIVDGVTAARATGIGGVKPQRRHHRDAIVQHRECHRLVGLEGGTVAKRHEAVNINLWPENHSVTVTLLCVCSTRV